MKLLEIYGGKICSLLISRNSAVKRKPKTGVGDRKQSIYFKQNMNKKWDKSLQERDVGSLD